MRDDFMGVPYHQRHAILAAEGATLTIYVPTDTKDMPGFEIAPRSGIVGGEPDENGNVLVHYEGWVYGAMQYEHLDARGKWEAGVKHAAGRAFVHYPTIARRLVPAHALNPVGTITADGERITVYEEHLVRAWLDR